MVTTVVVSESEENFIRVELTRAKPGSIRELMEFIYPGLSSLEGKCPPWPPDVFAVVATIMRRSGAYVRCIALNSTGAGAVPFLGTQWPERAEEIGRQWRQQIVEILRSRAGQRGKTIRQSLDEVRVPDEVQTEWSLLLGPPSALNLDDSQSNLDLCSVLIKLTGYADEASYNLGFPPFEPNSDPLVQAASFLLERNGKLSFCNRIHSNKVRVLAKKHTPQQGLTLRSMTHHLSLCMPWEVDARWHEIVANRHDDILNLLILPWPLTIDAKAFCQVHGPGADSLYNEDRLFEYAATATDPSALKKKVASVVEKAREKVAKLDALIFPELALTVAEWQIVEEIAIEQKLLLISGITNDVDGATGRPVNSCRIKLGNVTEPGVTREAYRQAKHHRWCLDRNQVLQYDLGGQIPGTKRCWENSHVGKREVFFATIGGWLTFSVLICEDLARQDPIAETLRSVGPNLVVALLMDGPQLTSRWSARYASVLADDPGTSVLTVTSLGMCSRSHPPGTSPFEPSRTIALWRDKLYGFREISLPEKTDACILSLSFEAREEFTADGRSDSKSTQVPVFSGLSFIEE